MFTNVQNRLLELELGEKRKVIYDFARLTFRLLLVLLVLRNRRI